MNKNFDLQLESFKLKLYENQILFMLFLLISIFIFYQFYSILLSITDN